MLKKKRDYWFKFIGYKHYCLPCIVDNLSLVTAVNELPYPMDIWWLDWIYEQGGKFQYGLEYSGDFQ